MGDPITFAKSMSAGKNIKQSMMDAGYSESYSRRGMKAVSKKMLKALSAEGYALADFGKSLSLEQLKNIAIGRAAQNAIMGTDKGINSAKLLGSHKELNLWTADTQVGVVVIGAGTQVMEEKARKLLQDESPSQST